MLFCGGTSSRLSSVVRGLSDAARCLFLLLGLCRGFFVSSASRVARCDAILFRFSGGCPSFFVWWRHACMQNIKKSWQDLDYALFWFWIFLFSGVFGVDFRPIVVPWVLLRPGLQRFKFAPFRGSAAALVVLTGWALVS